MPMSMFNNPILFAAVAVAAIGVAIFEYLNNERRNRQGNGPPRPPRDDPPRPPRDDPPKPKKLPKPPRDDPPVFYKSESSCSLKQSPTDSKPLSTSDNTLRKRNINQASLNENSSNDFKKITESSSTTDNQNIHDENFDKIMPDKLSNDTMPPSSSVNNSGKHNHDQDSQKSSSDDLAKSSERASINALKKSTETSSLNDSQDVLDKKFNENNYCKNMLDKLSNDANNVDKNFKSEKNIVEEETASPKNNLSPKAAKKSSSQMASDDCNKKVKHLKKPKNLKKSFQNIKDDVKRNVCSDNSNGYETESENSSSSDEDSYKAEVHNALKNDIHDMNITSKNEHCDRKEDKPNMVMIDPSDKSIKEEPANSTICEACEENPVNTRTYPCNHSYLCVDCAVRIFRIYKKCKVCLQLVEFVRF